MRKTITLVLAAVACAMLVAAGCTGTSTTTPATPAETTAATVIETTAAAESTPAAETTTAEPAATTETETPSWTGTWNTSYSVKDAADTVEIMTMTQEGTSVTGTYHNGLGTVEAVIEDGKLSGTWHDSDDAGEYSGFFIFEKSADGKSFTGVWVSTEEGRDALKTTAQYWNGALE